MTPGIDLPSVGVSVKVKDVSGDYHEGRILPSTRQWLILSSGNGHPDFVQRKYIVSCLQLR